MNVSVILPTYNERKNIPILIKDIIQELNKTKVTYEIIVIDDNSPDMTWDIVKGLEGKIDELTLIIRRDDKGLASAIKTGIKQSKYAIICIMDTDLSHPAKEIPRMLKYIGHFDMVWASRYVKDGKMVVTGIKRVQYALSYIFNLYLQLILKIQILDSTNGFFVTKKSVFNLIDLDEVFNDYGDYAFKLLYRLKQHDILLKEIPFVYEKRIYGKSKTKLFQISIKYFFESLKLRFF